MWRFLAVMSSLAICCSGAAQADEPTTAADQTAELAAQIKADPNDAKALNEYIGRRFSGIMTLLQAEKFDEATAELNSLSEFVEGLEPTETAAKTLTTRYASAKRSVEGRIELMQTPLADLQKKARENPTDAAAFSQVLSKYSISISELARTEPEQAGEIVAEAKTFVAEISEKDGVSDSTAMKNAMANAERTFTTLERQIAISLKHKQLIGQDAIDLSANIESWANGPTLTASELEGKVVLLDFWAVWCGPCIATFPHLNEWNEKYGESGLVIVGVTSYYNYKWDDEADRAVRSKADEPKVTPEDERAMLEKFAASHELKHRFGLQQGRALSEFYGVSGIPQAVLIDKRGKVRMIRVGSGEKNAAELGAQIQELLSEKI